MTEDREGRLEPRNTKKTETAMTFAEFLKIKKGIDPEGKDMTDLMDEYYEEYQDFLKGVKDGCSPNKD